MARSFKLKMALFAAVTSGVIFLAFALLFMATLRRVGLERFDRHLIALAEAQVRRAPGTDYWTHLDASLGALLGEGQPRPYRLLVLDRNGARLYASPRWPDTLTPEALGLAEYLAQPLMPGPADGRPPRPFRTAEGEGARDGYGGPPTDRPPGRGPRALLGAEPPLQRQPLRRPRTLTVAIDRRPWRLALLGSDTLTLAVAADLADLHAELRRHWRTFAVVGPLALALLAVGGWLLAGQALRPVATLAEVAAGITARGLDRRVQTPGADREFQSLVEVINRMLERLESSFRQAARFSADAAHELKTPLTILQGQLEQAVQRAPSGSAEQRTYAELLGEVQRLKAIVRKLLLLAQSDAGHLRLSLEPVCLNDELDALFDDLPLLAPGLAVRREPAPRVRVMADPDLLRQTLQNLVANACAHNRDGGEIACALTREGTGALLVLGNSTAPDAQLDCGRLFDRFYRGPRSRSRNTEGAGLGLSLAREIARAHGGDLTAVCAGQGWIDFRLTLPALAEESAT